MNAALENYFHLMTANGAVQIYRAAWKHGIIDALTKEPMTLPKLAQSTGLHEPAAQLLVNGLLALGLVEKSADIFRPGAVLQPLQGSYRSLGDEYWAHLGDWLISGTPIRRMNSAAEGETAYREQAAALAWMMRPAAAQAAAILGAVLPSDAAILDIGAGAGVWSLALLTALPGATATLVDRSGVLEVAAQYAAHSGMEHHVRCAAGDYRDIALPNGNHDLAILANVCHLESDEGNRSLIGRSAHWLKPGGRIAIIDISSNEEPLSAALYAIGLALRTEHAAVPTSDQIERWLQDVGFTKPEFHALKAPPGTMGLWTATRR